MKQIVIILAVAALVLTACSPASTNLSPASTDSQKGSVREINVQAYQYGFEPSVINVKKGENIRLVFTSRDVAHGVFIMDGIDKATKPFGAGQTEVIEFTADKTGTFTMQCSVYCGTDHTNMKGRIVVSE